MLVSSSLALLERAKKSLHIPQETWLNVYRVYFQYFFAGVVAFLVSYCCLESYLLKKI